VNLASFENPLSGEKGSVTSLSDWKNLIMGVFVILIVFNLGQRLAGWFSSKVPGTGVGFSSPVMGTAPAAAGVAYGIYQ
jgi:hypothetical protein